MHFRSLFLALGVVFASTWGFAQSAPPDATKPDAAKQEAPKQEDKRTPEQKKYDETIKNAKSQSGVFKVHRVEEKVYWEIPESKFDRIFLWQAEVAVMPQAIGYPGTAAGTRTITFSRRGKKVEIKDFSPSLRVVGNDAGTKIGASLNTIAPILYSFDVVGESPEKNLLIDVTSLFTSDPQDFTVRPVVSGAQSVDSSKTYIDKVKAFPRNIETRTFMTFSAGPQRTGFLGPLGGGGGWNASKISTIVHYSLVELPEKPMVGRYKDSRIGYFTTSFEQYGNPNGQMKTVEYINRYRLEKKDSSAPLSEPVEPIVFYVTQEVPERWRKYVLSGIEAWKPAFEQAGFKNAIIAKMAPTKEQDPDWDPEDARYSVIRWAPSNVQNAMGPSIQDPRSGETISAHVIMWNDITKLVQQWYFSQAAAIDPQARRIPFSDELMGKLVEYVVTHEVGHTLGLEHNFKASTAYTINQLRDKAFTSKYGVAASVMSYSRFNYVAQPGDGVTQTIGLVGPYDKFAIEYGYMQTGFRDPENERPLLDTLLSKQLSNHWLRFGNYKYSGIDPQMQSELIGSDAVEATRLGLMNIERIARETLLPATSKFGEDYTELGEMHGALVSQWTTELMHVLAQVGGVIEYDNHAGRGDADIFRPVPPKTQAAAVKLLLTKGVTQPSALFHPKILNKIRPTGLASGASATQSMILRGLMSEARINRLQDLEAQLGGEAYTVSNLVDDIVNSVFEPAAASDPKIDISTRNLQRAFLRMVDGRVNGSSASQTDLRPLMLAALRNWSVKLDRSAQRASDKVTRAHLNACRQDIARILNDTYSKGGGAAPAPISLAELLGLPGTFDAHGAHKHGPGCWRKHLPAALIELQKELEQEAKKPK